MTSNRAMPRITGASRARSRLREQMIDAARSHKGSMAPYPNIRSRSGRREGVISRRNIRFRRILLKKSVEGRSCL
jgi:hypothetical protein